MNQNKWPRCVLTMYRRLFPFSKQDTEPSLTSSQTMKEKTFAMFLSPFESYVISVQSILIWEKPYLSALSLVLVNLIFWLIVSYSHHFYSLVAIGCIVVFVYKTWIYQVWPEIRVPHTEEEDTEEWTPVNPQVLSVPEISRYLSNLVQAAKNWSEWLKQLRQEQPGSFCILMSSAFFGLAIIGQYMSGVTLAYIAVMTVMIGPGLALHVLPRTPPKWVSKFSNIFQMPREIADVKKVESDSELDEFMPDSNSEILEALNVPLENSEIDIEEDDDDTTLMARELGMEDIIGDELEDIVPPQSALAKIPLSKSESVEDESEFGLPVGASASDLFQTQEITFVPSHFKDSDDDDEDQFTEGLQFPEAADSLTSMSSAVGTGLTQSVMAAITSTVPQLSAVSQSLAASVLANIPATTLVASLTQASLAQSKRKQSDASDTDLTDFEIVTAAELASSGDE